MTEITTQNIFLLFSLWASGKEIGDGSRKHLDIIPNQVKISKDPP